MDRGNGGIAWGVVAGVQVVVAGLAGGCVAVRMVFETWRGNVPLCERSVREYREWLGRDAEGDVQSSESKDDKEVEEHGVDIADVVEIV